MSQSLIAEFASQFEATSAAARLLSLGLSREQLVIEIDERGMQPPASSSTPTTVIAPTLSSRGRDEEDRTPNQLQSGHTPATTVRPPAAMGWARLTVALPCAVDQNDVETTLKAAGATRIETSDRPAPSPNPAMWPENDTAEASDVERAIDAASPRRP